MYVLCMCICMSESLTRLPLSSESMLAVRKINREHGTLSHQKHSGQTFITAVMQQVSVVLNRTWVYAVANAACFLRNVKYCRN